MSQSTALKDEQILELTMALGLPPHEVLGVVDELPGTRLLSPGLADVQLGEVQRLGLRDRYPRCYDWENLLPALAEGSELLWIVRKERGQFRLYLGLKQNQQFVAQRD